MAESTWCISCVTRAIAQAKVSKMINQAGVAWETAEEMGAGELWRLCWIPSNVEAVLFEHSLTRRAASNQDRGSPLTADIIDRETLPAHSRPATSIFT